MARRASAGGQSPSSSAWGTSRPLLSAVISATAARSPRELIVSKVTSGPFLHGSGGDGPKVPGGNPLRCERGISVDPGVVERGAHGLDDHLGLRLLDLHEAVVDVELRVGTQDRVGPV